METDYSIIILGYKSLQNIVSRLDECYNGPNPPKEFILIINYYSEISWDILNYAKNEKRITRFVFNSQNIGFAKAMNLGYKISKSKNLIVLNDDCEINQETLIGLTSLLKDSNIGISTIELGGKSEDTINVPKGFILGLKKEAVVKSGDYIYDEIASPLGCERELTYRLKVNGYDLVNNHNLYFKHIHDISNNPTATINYLGENMSPQGQDAFQFYTESELNKKIEHFQNIIKNGKNTN